MNAKQHARTRERILASVTKKPGTDCWIWVRQISNTGYGRITLQDTGDTYLESAHRASYAAFIGPIPDNGMVHQTCGDRLCVNPKHLELRTSQS